MTYRLPGLKVGCDVGFAVELLWWLYTVMFTVRVNSNSDDDDDIFIKREPLTIKTELSAQYRIQL